MNNDNRKETEQKTEESRQQAMYEARKEQGDGGSTIHTINPFTGTAVNIAPEDIDGIEKKRGADTERE